MANKCHLEDCRPLQAYDVAVELAAHEVEVREDERLFRVKAARNDVLDVLLAQPVGLL
jgi:hypothetical protein